MSWPGQCFLSRSLSIADPACMELSQVALFAWGMFCPQSKLLGSYYFVSFFSLKTNKGKEIQIRPRSLSSDRLLPSDVEITVIFHDQLSVTNSADPLHPCLLLGSSSCLRHPFSFSDSLSGPDLLIVVLSSFSKFSAQRKSKVLTKAHRSHMIWTVAACLTPLYALFLFGTCSRHNNHLALLQFLIIAHNTQLQLMLVHGLTDFMSSLKYHIEEDFIGRGDKITPTPFLTFSSLLFSITYIYACMYVVWLHVCMNLIVYVHACIYMCMYICECKYVCVHV